ncbi:MAG: caspase family protein [Rhizobiaceae bacterium]
MRQGLGVLVLAFGAFSALTQAALAETRALVVGVSGYPALAEPLRLTGPKNDSREFANTIVRLGVPAANVTVLADGVSGLADGIATDGPGTKAAILAGLDRLAEESKAGDLVVFYFSGHGSQQPDLDGDEEGNADEIFLPYDVGKWGKDGVENALIDDELRGRVGAIRAKGADFFGVIDACHSATGFRDIPGQDARSREVDPADLGVPDFSPAQSRAVLDAAPAQSDGRRGRAAFFYAAQESEEALEKVPPNGEEGQNFGVFTYNLVRRMNETPALTYRNLHQAVMADIKRNTLMSTQTPEIEGDLIDEPVLQLSGATARRQWQIFGGKMQGGQLDGITAGSIVGLYADPAADDGEAVAYGKVEQAGATRSVVAPTGYPCDDDGSCPTPADEATFKKGRFARLAQPGIDLTVSLSEPVRIDAGDGHDYAPAIAALNAAVGAPPLSTRVSLRKSGYDVAVALVDGKLAFAPSAGAIDANGPGSSPRLTLPADPAQAAAAVSDAVSRIGKVLALQRLGDNVEGLKDVGFSTEISVAKAKPSAIRDGVCSTDRADYEPAVAAGDAPRFAECDIVSVAMKNGGRKPLDVTVLLAAADFSLTPVWPQDGASSRILQSESKTAEMLQMAPGAPNAADERLIFLAVPGVGRASVVFDNLEQEGLRAAPDDPVGIAALRDLLATGLNDMSRATTTAPARIEEEMSISVRPFHVEKGRNG